MRHLGGQPGVSSFTARVTLLSVHALRMAAHGAVGVKVVLRPAAVSATLPRGAIHTPGTQTHRGLDTPRRRKVPARALPGRQPQMGCFVLKTTSPCAAVGLMHCLPLRSHISHTHQTKVCLRWEKGGKEAGGDTAAEPGWVRPLPHPEPNPGI